MQEPEIRIVHGADFHLGGTDIDQNEESRRRHFIAFSRLVSWVIEQRIQILLIAGDFIEVASITEDEILEVRDSLQTLSDADVKVFIVGGNHDPFVSRSPYRRKNFWPKHVYFFDGPKTLYIEKLNLAITGHSFTKSRQVVGLWPELVETYQRSAESQMITDQTLSVALLHGQLGEGGESNNNYLEKDEVLAGPFDYVALGHVHGNPPQLVEQDGVRCAYPGPIQGTSYADAGARGILYLRYRGKSLEEEVFLSLAPYLYEIVEISLNREDDVLAKIDASLDTKHEEGNAYALRLTLLGEVKEPISEREILTALGSRYQEVELIDRTISGVDHEALRDEKGIAGVFYRDIQKQRGLASHSKRRIYDQALRYGLEALGKERKD